MRSATSEAARASRSQRTTSARPPPAARCTAVSPEGPSCMSLSTPTWAKNRSTETWPDAAAQWNGSRRSDAPSKPVSASQSTRTTSTWPRSAASDRAEWPSASSVARGAPCSHSTAATPARPACAASCNAVWPEALATSKSWVSVILRCCRCKAWDRNRTTSSCPLATARCKALDPSLGIFSRTIAQRSTSSCRSLTLCPFSHAMQSCSVSSRGCWFSGRQKV
mmetsp:Transcript_52107/g.169257  ORF Transcript_52107/g.169257 Transcript_52107/m.169257 type:complete len:223 (-) Transcript_52107:771-1439(-)